MKKLVFGTIFLLLVCFSSSLSASNYTSLVEERDAVLAANDTRYWITEMQCEESSGYVTSVSFVVNWQWGGFGPAQIVYQVEVLGGGYPIHMFMDSAIGQPTGSKRYSIKVNPSAGYKAMNMSVTVRGETQGA